MSSLAPTTTAVLAEKPQVARDIAQVVGATKRGDGFLHGNGWVVTWAIGHLVTLAQPHEIDLAWKRWRMEALPMLPADWPLVEVEDTRDQLEVVRRVLTSPKVATLVCATDAGREGELIFRYIYEKVGCTKAWKRLWISSLTPAAIRDGLAKLRDGHDLDPLAAAAKGRSRADWLVGMNLSRAYSLRDDDELSVGRVQTPTLAMVVERELALRAFVPEPYFEVNATFARESTTWDGRWFEGDPKKPVRPEQKRLPGDGERARAIAARVKGRPAEVEVSTSEEKRMPSPLLYDLTELQRHANRLYGLSAKQTLDAAQRLYEEHKLLSYPRTDSRHLSEAAAGTLPEIVRAVAPAYPGLVADPTGERPLGRRFVDDAKVTDHHAIVPTATPLGDKRLRDDERKIYDLVCRRLLQAFHGDHVTQASTVVTRVTSDDAVDRFVSTGTALVDAGWKVLDPGRPDTAIDLPKLAKGDEAVVRDAVPQRKETEPPRRFTEATLLTAMESAGKTLDDKELSLAMRERGLGTPATRASILETLIARKYMLREGKSLVPTDKGIRLVERVHPRVKSPAMTGEWEANLRRIQRGEADVDAFLRGIEAYVSEVVGEVKGSGPPRDDGPAAPEGAFGSEPPPPMDESIGGWDDLPEPPAGGRDEARLDGWSPSPPRASSPPRAPSPAPPPGPRPPPAPLVNVTRETLRETLAARFGFASFRAHQEEACLTAAQGRDMLLVMPTGAGKSLCYQLPGVVRGGSTLVVSPLIALMEDQVAKLQAGGFRAARVHQGRDRGEVKETLGAWRRGELDFLFVAPERLAVRSFLSLVAEHKPNLVAIDEAHCISQWGHDFRPEYRMLGQRLPLLRPAPILALTATATPRVQSDIAELLGLDRPVHLIHGFRRDNIAIETVEVLPSLRTDKVRELLEPDDRRPAIVYASTRKDAEACAKALDKRYRVAAYHAGMKPDAREAVQARFLSGKLDVIVATIAFGMGIDKADVRTVVHTALPGSVEGYYQEIGRAGRDGRPSRAVLLYGFVDKKTHEFFLDRDHPEPSVLRDLYEALPKTPRLRTDVRDDAPVKGLADDEAWDRALDKLWIHGGVVLDDDDRVARGPDTWEKPYAAIRNHRVAALDQVLRYAEAPGCKMLFLLRHFGDPDDTRPCGVCQACAPDEAVASELSAPTAEEQDHVRAILRTLGDMSGTSSGKLFKEAFPREDLDRRSFEHLLSAMAQNGLVRVEADSWKKDGKEISFTRVHLLDDAGDALPRMRLARRPTARGGKKRSRKGAPSPLTKHVVGGRSEKPKRAAVDDGDPVARELRAFRLDEAKKRKMPAYRVFSDRTLIALAERRPSTLGELGEVSGVGPLVLRQFGDGILRAIARAR